MRKPQDVRPRDRKVTGRPFHRKRGTYILHATRVSGKPAPWAGVTLPILKSRFLFTKSWPTERKNVSSKKMVRKNGTVNTNQQAIPIYPNFNVPPLPTLPLPSPFPPPSPTRRNGLRNTFIREQLGPFLRYYNAKKLDNAKFRLGTKHTR